MDEKEMTMREALNLALDQALAADDRVFLLGEDIADPGASGPTAGLSTKYGHDRVLDTPISEAAIVGAAIGAAIDGLLPVAEIMIMDFIGIAADQLINNAAKLRFMTAGRTTAPITVRTQVYGGLATGATHSQTLEAWFMHIPGMKVIVPSTPRDGKGLLTSAIFDEDPCLFVETIRLQGQKGLGANRSRIRDPARPGRHQAARLRRHPDQLRAQRARVSEGRPAAAGTGRQRRGRRPANPGAAGHRDHRRVGASHPTGRSSCTTPSNSRAREPRSSRPCRPNASVSSPRRSSGWAHDSCRRPRRRHSEAQIYPSAARIVEAASRALARGGRPWLTSSFASRGSRWPSRRPNSPSCSSRPANMSRRAHPIYVIATEKVEQEIEAGASGTVQWTGEIGTTYDIGAEIGVITS